MWGADHGTGCACVQARDLWSVSALCSLAEDLTALKNTNSLEQTNKEMDCKILILGKKKKKERKQESQPVCD